jgi:hypothetical protein
MNTLAMNTPTYRPAKLPNKKLLELIQLPNTYDVFNSAQMASHLTAIKLNRHHKCITIDIKDLFTNTPITETINIGKQKLRYNHLHEDTITQYIKLLRTVLTQNYFTHDNKFYTCNRGVAMGSPISNTVAEMFLQHHEYLFIKHWIEDTSIVYYSRYVDDIFTIFNTKHTTEDIILTRTTA